MDMSKLWPMLKLRALGCAAPMSWSNVSPSWCLWRPRGRPSSSSIKLLRLRRSTNCPDYDAIIFGSPTRFGSVTSQMRSFLDRAGGLWAQGKLVGKVGSAFTSTATQHGGQESTILTFIPTLLHFGMVVVGLPYDFQGQMRLDEILGGSPYGAATISGTDGSRRPSAIELEAARFQGRHVASIAERLFDQAAAMEDRAWPRRAGQSH